MLLILARTTVRALRAPRTPRAATTARYASADAARKRVVFLGSPDVAALTLDALLDAAAEDRGGGFDVVAAVSQPPARGRADDPALSEHKSRRRRGGDSFRTHAFSSRGRSTAASRDASARVSAPPACVRTATACVRISTARFRAAAAAATCPRRRRDQSTASSRRVSKASPRRVRAGAAREPPQHRTVVATDDPLAGPRRRRGPVVGPDAAASSRSFGRTEAARTDPSSQAPKGRKRVLQPCDVQALAEARGVPCLTPASARDPEFLEELAALEPDVCVTAASVRRAGASFDASRRRRGWSAAVPRRRGPVARSVRPVRLSLGISTWHPAA